MKAPGVNSFGWTLIVCEAPRGVQYELINQSINQSLQEASINLIIFATHRTVSIRSERRAQILYGPASWSSSFSCQTCRACSFRVFISIICSWVPHRSKPDTLLKPFATTVLHSFHPHHKAFDSLLISSSWFYNQTGPQFTHDDFFLWWRRDFCYWMAEVLLSSCDRRYIEASE